MKSSARSASFFELASGKGIPVAMALAVVVMLAACGRNSEEPGLIPDVVEDVVHPDMAGLEPIAAQLVIGQKQILETRLADEKVSKENLARAFGRMGMLYYAFRYKPAAQTCLQNALFYEPESFQWHYYLGNLYRETHEPEKAAPHLEKAYELNPRDLPATVALAQSLRENDRLERAKELFQKALATDPDCAPAHMGLGLIASSEQQFQEAVTHFQTVLRLQPRASAANYPLALAYRALGDMESAEKHLAARGDIEPRIDDPLMKKVNQPRAHAHFRMAETLRLSGNLDDAIPHYELVIRLEPDNPHARMGRELTLIKLERFVGAVIALHEDLADFPNLVVFHHMLARILAASPDDRVRDGGKALVILRELTKGAVTPELMESLGMAFAAVGRFGEAVKAQKKAIELAEESGAAELAVKMADNLALYQSEKACHTPWREDDPLFDKVAYSPKPAP